MKTAYIAGPMRGLPENNFPAFHAAEALGVSLGWSVISPANMDRADPVSGSPERKQRAYAHRDTQAILSMFGENGDAIALLPGWEKSIGARAEKALADWVGLAVLDARNFEPLRVASPDESILHEAYRITRGDRNDAYGHPLDDFTRSAAIWSAILGHAITPEKVGLCMAGLKISRECNGHKRDNLVDCAGYVSTVEMVIAERKRRSA